ncbi:MAG: invasion associated locus B family protein, partial [Mesorhizobium sp.]
MTSWLSTPLAKVIFLAASLSASVANAAPPQTAAPPSGTVKSTHGAWSIIC